MSQESPESDPESAKYGVPGIVPELCATNDGMGVMQRIGVANCEAAQLPPGCVALKAVAQLERVPAWKKCLWRIAKFFIGRQYIIAFNKKDYALAEVFLKWGADPNTDKISRITYSRRFEKLLDSALQSCAKEVELLLRYGADVKAMTPLVERWDKSQYTALMLAAYSGSTECLELLIAYGASPSESSPLTGDTALHVAASEVHPQVVSLLLAQGVNANAVNHDGHTPLDEALWTNIYYRSSIVIEERRRRARETMERLIENSATLGPKRREERGACVGHAAMTGSSRIVEYILDQVEPDAGTAIAPVDLNWALKEAVECRDANTVELLIRRGASGEYTSNGWTILHEAARWGDIRILKMFLTLPAVIKRINSVYSTGPVGFAGQTIPDNWLDRDDTPLDIAYQSNNKAAAELIKEYGGRSGRGR